MLIRPAAQPQATDDVASTNQPTVAGRTGIRAPFGERQRPWTKAAPVTNEFTDPVHYTPKSMERERQIQHLTSNGHTGAVSADGPVPHLYCRCEWYCR